ncbi:MAG: hypothetical protein SXG53_16280, partial [Pseudomonadota bacterium]|nr:hypothetical protein [Pseudomonadota bacterium]
DGPAALTPPVAAGDLQRSRDIVPPGLQSFVHRKLVATIEEYVSDLRQGREAHDASGTARMTAEQAAHLRDRHGRDF